MKKGSFSRNQIIFFSDSLNSIRMNFTVKRILRVFLFITSYIAFLVIGAILFATIEGPEEQRLTAEVRAARSNFLKDHACVDGKWKVAQKHFY